MSIILLEQDGRLRVTNENELLSVFQEQYARFSGDGQTPDQYFVDGFQVYLEGKAPKNGMLGYSARTNRIVFDYTGYSVTPSVPRKAVFEYVESLPVRPAVIETALRTLLTCKELEPDEYGALYARYCNGGRDADGRYVLWDRDWVPWVLRNDPE